MQQRPGERLFAHDHCAQDAILTKDEPQVIGVGVVLDREAFELLTPGVAVTACERHQVPVAATSADRADDCRRNSADLGHVERRRSRRERS